MQLDIKDPNVLEEMKKVEEEFGDQRWKLDWAVEQEMGWCPENIDDYELKAMLVEYRLRKDGKMGKTNVQKDAAPAANASAFEKIIYENPAYKALYEKYKAKGLQNIMNLLIEICDNFDLAKTRYAGNELYDKVFEEADKALNAPPPPKEVSSAKLSFSGFPPGMGEDALMATFEAFGQVVDLSCEDDGMSTSGTVEMDSVDAAKAAMEKWDGVDMGLGDTLQFNSI